MTVGDPRVSGVCALLREHDLEGAAVRVCGSQREIVVLEARAELQARLAQLAPAIKRLGFRYVTMDLAHVSLRDA